jgi:uptake hydrogenase small subunit
MQSMLWIESGSCSGESMSILGADGTGQDGETLADFLRTDHVELLWHPSLSLESPSDLETLIEAIVSDEKPLTLLCVEGSILNGPFGTGQYDTFHGRPKRDIIKQLAAKAKYVIALGTCAAYGGIPAAPPNPTEATGLQFDGDRPGGLLDADFRSLGGLPVINVSGCPVSAATMIATMRAVLRDQPLACDNQNRPDLVRPCMSGDAVRRCETRTKVGYNCYACISPKFPADKQLFRYAAPKQPRS